MKKLVLVLLIALAVPLFASDAPKKLTDEERNKLMLVLTQRENIGLRAYQLKAEYDKKLAELNAQAAVADKAIDSVLDDIYHERKVKRSEWTVDPGSGEFVKSADKGKN